MGFLDALKKLLPKSEPMPWDTQTVRHHQFNLRLPEGWRFTKADWGRAAAIGPANQAVEFHFSVQTHVRHAGMTSHDAPKAMEVTQRDAPEVLELMRMLVRHDAKFESAPTQATLPNGVFWTEASEVKGAEQQFVVYVLKLQEMQTTQICLRTSVPVSSGGLGAKRLETLRGALRAVEWN